MVVPTLRWQKFWVWSHKALETGVIEDDYTQKVVEVFRKDILTDIDEVWAQEKSLIHDKHKYCGKFDGIGIYKGKLTLFDYKKTNKPKTDTNSSMRRLSDSTLCIQKST